MARSIMEEKKITNKDLYDEQLKTLKLFYDRGILSLEQYEFELKVLKEKMKI